MASTRWNGMSKGEAEDLRHRRRIAFAVIRDQLGIGSGPAFAKLLGVTRDVVHELMYRPTFGLPASRLEPLRALAAAKGIEVPWREFVNMRIPEVGEMKLHPLDGLVDFSPARTLVQGIVEIAVVPGIVGIVFRTGTISGVVLKFPFVQPIGIEHAHPIGRTVVHITRMDLSLFFVKAFAGTKALRGCLAVGQDQFWRPKRVRWVPLE